MEKKIKTKNIFIVLFLLIVTGCGTSKNFTQYKLKAETAEQKGNYSEASNAWKNYFNQFPADNDLQGEVYAQAAQTAFNAGETEQAVDWFDQARYRDYADPEMYTTLTKIYRKQDNLSKELSALEFYAEKFNTSNQEVNSRLFSIYFEIDRVNNALDMWKILPKELKKQEENLEKYFLLNKQVDNDEVCDEVSRQLLELNPNNLEALDWNAKKIYNQAEDHYQHEMKKYENNQTRSQYRILLDELDKVTADFKKALGYFEKLWQLNPGNRREYASYMANIYVRFNNEKKATYYRNFVN